MFGRNIIAAIIGRMKYEIEVARARGLFIMSAASKMSVEVPKSAPRIKGIVFFKLIRRELARGTKSPIVIDDENTIPVKTTPRRYVFHFDLKYLLTLFFVFSSPPKILIIDLLKYLKEKAKTINAINRTIKTLFFARRKFVNGDVTKPTTSGKGSEEVFPPNKDTINNEERETNWKKYSRRNARKTTIALKIA